MSGPKATVEHLVVGGIPRVHLLPPEVTQRKHSRKIRRRLGLGVVLVIILVVVGTGAATVAMLAAQSTLLAQQNQAASLLAQQKTYSAVLNVQSDVSAITAAQRLATAQEILWQPYVDQIRGTLPPGMSITSIDTSLDAPFGVAKPSVIPLQGPRIATIKIAVKSDQSSISAWLDSLTTLTGFVDATPGSVDVDTDGKYKSVVEMHINGAALANRFAPVKKG